jgi:hypothetical protein
MAAIAGADIRQGLYILKRAFSPRIQLKGVAISTENGAWPKDNPTVPGLLLQKVSPGRIL